MIYFSSMETYNRIYKHKKAIKVLTMIDQAQQRIAWLDTNLVSEAQSVFFNREYYLNRLDIAERAHQRLKQYYYKNFEQL